MLRSVFPLARPAPAANIEARLPIRTFPMPLRRFGPVLLLVTLVACGGDDGSPTIPPPSNPPGNGQNTQNPCVAALAQAEADGEPLAPAMAAELTGKGRWGLAADKRDVADLLWRSAVGARAANRAAPSPDAISQDIGDIAVIEDDGTLLLGRNGFDVRNVGLRFERNGAGGYDVSPTTAGFRTSLGRRITLTDDDSATETIPFAFSYYGRSFTAVFVNSDGNLTFDEADSASTARGFARLLGGPPRVAPFFADLDPSTGGRVFVDAASDAFTVTWCGVRGFDSAQTTTVQASLFATGAIDVKFGPEVTLTEALVAVSPGRGSAFTPVDLSAGNRLSGGAGAVGERFADEAELDTAQAARRFFASHADRFDQLVFWTDTSVMTDSFAFESTVSNAIRGLGSTTFNQSADFGSAGTLESVMVMDRVAKYGDDPNAKILGENSALAVIAHETGHRWLTQLQFSDGRGGTSDAMLGRQRAHWSFFMDSDASVMEGNDIEDLGGGSFRTIAAAERYSRLDLYGMGLVAARDVPAVFYVDAPTNVSPSRDRESAPRVGVTLNGTRRTVLIEDIVAAVGPRQPTVDASPKIHRQAWVYVITRGTSPSQADLTRLERMRQAFEPYFRRIADNRMTLTTTLR
jgi:hypothetical protein